MFASRSLPLPDEETTEALAFLAHDALGRIVEKAISLMFADELAAGNPVLELRGGMQLQPQHIAGALRSQSLASGLFGGRGGGAKRTGTEVEDVIRRFEGSDDGEVLKKQSEVRRRRGSAGRTRSLKH